MLLEHEERYTVIKSKSAGILQHDGFSWEVMGNKFIHLDSISGNSRVLDKNMKNLLSGMTRESRERFIDSIFEALESKTGAKTLTELNSDKIKLFKVWGSLDDESKMQFRRIAALLVSKKVEKKKK